MAIIIPHFLYSCSLSFFSISLLLLSPVSQALSLSLSPQATMNARPQRILDSGSLTQSAPASPTSKGAHIHQAG